MFVNHCFKAAFILSLCLPLFTNAQPCSESFKRETRKRNILNCEKKTLGAEFGWNYSNYTRKFEILFGAKLDGDMGWLAWGLNPGKQPGMVGTRALIGIKLKNKTVLYDKYNITHQTKLGCELRPSEIELDVRNFRFFPVDPTQYYIIHATIVLPKEYNDSHINLVWQVGDAADGKQPMMHPKSLHNFDCKETIDLINGTVRSVQTHELQRLRKVHGVLNIVGWGTVLPLGAIIARYFRKFPIESRKWFCLHVSCQILGYFLGSIGWIIGILLGNASKHYDFRTHRILGIIIFTFTTLQMLALRLKPTRNDEYRVYWNMYHHFLGYALLAIIAVNIFQGIAILNADHNWKCAYIVVLGLLGFTALILEISTWIRFYLDKKLKGSASSSQVVAQSSPSQGSTSGAHKVSPPSEKEDPGASTGSATQLRAIRKSSSNFHDVSQPSFAKGSGGGTKDISAATTKS